MSSGFIHQEPEEYLKMTFNDTQLDNISYVFEVFEDIVECGSRRYDIITRTITPGMCYDAFNFRKKMNILENMVREIFYPDKIVRGIFCGGKDGYFSFVDIKGHCGDDDELDDMLDLTLPVDVINESDIKSILFKFKADLDEEIKNQLEQRKIAVEIVKRSAAENLLKDILAQYPDILDNIKK